MKNSEKSEKKALELFNAVKKAIPTNLEKRQIKLFQAMQVLSL